jgi:hypothetical protein
MGERVLPEHTQPVPQRARPHRSTELEFSDSSDVMVEGAIADQSTLENAVPAGLSGISKQQLPSPAGGAGGYDGFAAGAPQWPLPRTGPEKRVILAAGVGLAMAVIVLILVVVLTGNSLQAVLSGPSGTPSRVVSTSPSQKGQQAAAAVPTTTPIPPTATPVSPPDWLVVAPTQVALDCHSTQSVALQLTNTGPEAVSWAAETNSSHQSGVAIQPASGSLPAGGTQTITISISSGSSTGGQGTILFAVVSGQQATNPAQVSYTTSGCGGGD